MLLQLVVDMLHRRLTQSNPHKVYLATALAGKVRAPPSRPQCPHHPAQEQASSEPGWRAQLLGAGSFLGS